MGGTPCLIPSYVGVLSTCCVGTRSRMREVRVAWPKSGVLILQDDIENRNPHYPFVIVVPLTSRKVDAIYAEDVLLPKGTANLPVTSKALLGLIFAVSKEALLRWIGQVDEDHLVQVDAVVQRLLGLSERSEGKGSPGSRG